MPLRSSRSRRAAAAVLDGIKYKFSEWNLVAAVTAIVATDDDVNIVVVVQAVSYSSVFATFIWLKLIFDLQKT